MVKQTLFSHDKTKIQVNYDIDDRMYFVTKVAIKRKSRLL